MEPVSLSLGIIPLIGGSIKLYKASRSRLRVFRHYSGEVDRVRKQFDRQRQFFLNEVHLALRLVIEDESLVQDMVENGDHLYWQRQSLERAMLDRLNANNCQVLKEIAADIGKTIGNVEKELECFECLEEARREASAPICLNILIAGMCSATPCADFPCRIRVRISEMPPGGYGAVSGLPSTCPNSTNGSASFESLTMT